MTHFITTAFQDHPASVGESYGEHAGFATKTGGLLLIAGLAAITHGFFPFLCKSTASRIIGQLNAKMTRRFAE